MNSYEGYEWNVRDLVIELCAPDYSVELGESPDIVLRDEAGNEYSLRGVRYEGDHKLVFHIKDKDKT
jgi:hypothetical protein